MVYGRVEFTAIPEKKATMQAVWSDANQCYATYFGDEFTDVNGRTLHPTYLDLLRNCNACGIELTPISNGIYELSVKASK